MPFYNISIKRRIQTPSIYLGRMITKGVYYVAYGRQARDQLTIALTSLHKVHPSWPVSVVSNEYPPRGPGIPAVNWIQFDDVDPGARWAKLNMDLLSPYDWTVYWDADTRARYPMDGGWRLLEAGWELLIAPSMAQSDQLFDHIVELGVIDARGVNEGEAELEASIAEIGGRPILALQGGAIWFRKTPAIKAFFQTWRTEWERWRNQDQAALVRALRRCPVKLWLLSNDWNGGALMGHYHSRARRSGLRGAIPELV